MSESGRSTRTNSVTSEEMNKEEYDSEELSLLVKTLP